ncbi:lysozyme family protein [Sporosarcina sp. ITBMC105]
MAREVYRIEIPIETKDDYSAGLNEAKKDVESFKKTAESAAKGPNTLGKSVKKTEKDVTKFQQGMRTTRERLHSLTASKWQLTVSAADRASKVVSQISGFVNRVANRNYRFTLRALDMASSTIRGVGRMITSIPSVITIALTYVGVNKLKDATVGAAMSFEEYEVSMTHWLNGNVKQAKELVTWMGQFADTTPFSSVDLFPALTRGIGVSNGDVKQAQDLLRLASDMAALTPGKTVSDAMESLADAQMGEMERLKEFNVKVSKKEFDKIGYSGVIEQLAKKFDGGARKLSETSAGIISTLKGYRSSIFRSFGTGFLDPMKPRLDAINQWLADNQETWGRWKSTMERHGRQASEFVFSRLETGFKFIRSRYLDNDDFMSLDFKGKIDFIMSDINQWWTDRGKPGVSSWWESSGKPWASDTGLSIGKAIFDGIVLGIKEGVSSIGDLWKDAFKDPSAGSIGGALTATMLAGAAGSMILSPFLRVGGAVGRAAKWGGSKVKGGYDKIQSSRAAKSAGMPKGAYQDNQGRWHQKDGKFISAKDVQVYQGVASRSARHAKPRGSWIPKWLGGKAASGGTAPGSKLLRRVPVLGTLLGALAIGSASAEDRPGVVGGVAGGLAGAKGGAILGAALGSVVPGVGTAIGGAAGGLIGGIGGAFGGEWIGNNWDTVKEKASEAASWIGTKFSEAKETLSSSLFSGEWWSGKWENVKSVANSTIFNGGWWSEQAGFVFGYLESTLFSGEWWGSKWDDVKGWTSEKWESANEIWETSKLAIGNTLFSGDWWNGRWDYVKGWTSEKWNTFSTVWEATKGQISATLFSKDWWSGKWDTVKGWAGTALSGIKSGFNIVKDRFNKGRERGQQAGSATKYANGGYINRPHLGLVGEAGPEMIIPLSSGRRNRAMELYERTGRMLGVKAYANGGVVGKLVEPLIDTTASSSTASVNHSPASGNTSVSFGPVSVAIESGGADSAESIIEAVINEFGNAVIPQLREALTNRYA